VPKPKRPDGPALTPRQQLTAPFSSGRPVDASTSPVVDQSTSPAVTPSTGRRQVASYKIDARVKRGFLEFVKGLNRDRPVDAELEIGAVAQRALALYMTTYPDGEPAEVYITPSPVNAASRHPHRPLPTPDFERGVL
jgi:hypothetical protein